MIYCPLSLTGLGILVPLWGGSLSPGTDLCLPRTDLCLPRTPGGKPGEHAVGTVVPGENGPVALGPLTGEGVRWGQQLRVFPTLTATPQGAGR